METESSLMTGNKLLSMAFADLSQTVGKLVVLEINMQDHDLREGYSKYTYL